LWSKIAEKCFGPSGMGRLGKIGKTEKIKKTAEENVQEEN